ncbi:MAG: hypothetical protein AD742_11740 [Methylibium sp. NZG]|nr:MAG: hypothetical protein AD742_11740 [Methylibium sp. NZG]
MARGHRPAEHARAAATSHVGIGLRQPHYAQVLGEAPPLGFVEVHSENFFADGGAALGVLHEVRERYAVSLHGVGLGLGSMAGVDGWHLDRLERLVNRIEPVRVSDHACFARATLALAGPGHAVVHGNDLLPIAFTTAALDAMVSNVSQVQERLRRPMLVENLSAYLSFRTGPDDEPMGEPQFFAELCRRAGCGMLLDVNNLMVNALNALNPLSEAADAAGGAPTLARHLERDLQRDLQRDLERASVLRRSPLQHCCDFIDALPPGIVGEVHVAGFCDTERGLVIDDHGSCVRADVWRVYEHALRRFGPLPTLVEWDTDLPALDVLLGEAAHAAALQREVCRTSAAFRPAACP